MSRDYWCCSSSGCKLYLRLYPSLAGASGPPHVIRAIVKDLIHITIYITTICTCDWSEMSLGSNQLVEFGRVSINACINVSVNILTSVICWLYWSCLDTFKLPNMFFPSVLTLGIFLLEYNLLFLRKNIFCLAPRDGLMKRRIHASWASRFHSNTSQVPWRFGREMGPGCRLIPNIQVLSDRIQNSSVLMGCIIWGPSGVTWAAGGYVLLITLIARCLPGISTRLPTPWRLSWVDERTLATQEKASQSFLPVYPSSACWEMVFHDGRSKLPELHLLVNNVFFREVFWWTLRSPPLTHNHINRPPTPWCKIVVI